MFLTSMTRMLTSTASGARGDGWPSADDVLVGSRSAHPPSRLAIDPLLVRELISEWGALDVAPG